MGNISLVYHCSKGGKRQKEGGVAELRVYSLCSTEEDFSATCSSWLLIANNTVNKFYFI